MAQGVVDILNRVFRVTIRMSCRLTQFQTSFCLRDFGLPNADAASIHAEAKTWMTDSFRLGVSNQIKIESLSVERLLADDYFTEPYSNVNGNSGTAQMSTFLACVVSLKSSSRKRWATNRMFWPYPGQMVADVADPAPLANITTAANALLTEFGGVIISGEGKLIALGAPANGLPPTEANPYRWIDVEAVKVNPLVTSLRSRKAGVGS